MSTGRPSEIETPVPRGAAANGAWLHAPQSIVEDVALAAVGKLAQRLAKIALGPVDIHFSQIMVAIRNSTAANDTTVFS
jgi:hypothetical protein